MPPSCTERQDFNHWWRLETTWPFCCLLSFCQALCHIGVRFYLRLLINSLYHVWIDTGITSSIILTLVWHFLSFFGQVPWPCWTASTVPSLGLICSYGKSPNISLLDISKDPSGGFVFIIITLWSLNMWFFEFFRAANGLHNSSSSVWHYWLSHPLLLSFPFSLSWLAGDIPVVNRVHLVG